MSALIKKDYEAPSVEVVMLTPRNALLNVSATKNYYNLVLYDAFLGWSADDNEFIWD